MLGKRAAGVPLLTSPSSSYNSMGWLCQLPSRLWFYARTRRPVRALLLVLGVFVYCEFLHYYLVLLLCTWPVLQQPGLEPGSPDVKPLRAMILGDTHLLGTSAHWLDKLRREWMMTRSFQASMMIHSPDIVFILGDLLDEGKIAPLGDFEREAARFKRMFRTPAGVETQVLVGNHDVGFHYMMSDRKLDRFVKTFDSPSVKLLRVRDVIFVMLNSMAMEGDNCNICTQAVSELKDIKWKLKCAKARSETASAAANVCDNLETFSYSRPILMQHFPMYRRSDENCSTPDAAPAEEKEIPFREKMDCLSKEGTEQLFEMLQPRLVISAHTHHGCYRVHDNGVPEWTVASYNWRNKQNPTFFLAEITSTDYAIKRCYLPNELTIFSIYITGSCLLILCLIIPSRVFKTAVIKESIITNKSH